MNTPPFKVGQKVVALRDSTPGFPSVYKKGDVLTCSSFKKAHTDSLWNVEFEEKRKHVYHDCRNFAPIEESRSRIQYVAVSESLREKAVEIAAVETN